MPLGYRSTVRPGCRLDSEGPRATGKIRPAARTLENLNSLFRPAERPGDVNMPGDFAR